MAIIGNMKKATEKQLKIVVNNWQFLLSLEVIYGHFKSQFDKHYHTRTQILYTHKNYTHAKISHAKI